jgi:phytoene synthase
MVTSGVSLAEAYAACERTAREHYENFPVASLLVPAAMRRHISAVYAFARAADDFADEGVLAAGERLALLDGWSVRLHAAASGHPLAVPAARGEPADSVAIFEALAATMRDRQLPVALFDDLLSAFRQDVTVHRYQTWADLLDYCRRSANPVGRLVLRIGGHVDERLDRWSDAICTALQLANFWQDLRIDWERGRLYVPDDVWRLHGASEAVPSAGLTPTLSIDGRWRMALADVVARTRTLFEEGRPLCDLLTGRLRYELRATWLGGVRILDRLVAVDYDAVAHRPSLGVGDAPWFAWRLLTWR